MYHTGLHTGETVWPNAGLGSTIGRVRSTPVVWPLDTWGSIRWHLHGFWNRKYSVKSILYLLGHSKLFFVKERATLKSICIISVHNWHIYSIVWGGAGQWDAHICFSTVCLYWANSHEVHKPKTDSWVTAVIVGAVGKQGWAAQS